MRPHTLLSLASAFALAACSANGDAGNVKVAFDSAKADSVAAAPLAEGDVRVTSTDGAVILSLVGDSVRFQLSDSLRSSVKEQIDTAGGNGLGNMIARQVSGVVANAMGFVASVHVRDVENVRYEGGMIKFESSRGNGKFSMGGKGESEHTRFSEDDGERFVRAVKARQAALAR